jgi:hypothetical protein
MPTLPFHRCDGRPPGIFSDGLRAPQATGTLTETASSAPTASCLLLLALLFALPSAHAQKTPDFLCVARTATAKAPPRSMPMPIRREHGDDDDNDDRNNEGRGTTRNGLSLQQPARGSLNFAAVCPTDQVPRANRPIYHGPKGNPLFASDPENAIFQAADRRQFIREHVLPFDQVYGAEGRGNPPPPPPNSGCDGTFWYGECFYYGSAGFTRVADGAGMTQSIERPVYVNIAGPTNAGHSLNEIALMDGLGINNVVELGWFVSTDVYGDPDPHIFVYHWIGAQETCYDDCGWQQVSGTYYPGQNIGASVGKQVYVGYVYYQGNWWAWFDDQWMGYFPGSIWNGAFAKTARIQWFGEVASLNGIPPQTQMGSGQFPSAPASASMSTLCDVDAVAWVCWYRDQQVLASTPPNPVDYDIQHTGFGAVRYGGPGQ